jgi:hypothetical protein
MIFKSFLIENNMFKKIKKRFLFLFLHYYFYFHFLVIYNFNFILIFKSSFNLPLIN